MADEKQRGEETDGLKELALYLRQRDVVLEQTLAAINADFALALRFTCMACPVQIEGEIDGLALYFRARWETWSLAIASNHDQAVHASRQADAVFITSPRLI